MASLLKIYKGSFRCLGALRPIFIFLMEELKALGIFSGLAICPFD